MNLDPMVFDFFDNGFLFSGRRMPSAQFSSAMPISIDNVTEYLYAGTPQEVWNPEDFPCAIPPFRKTLFVTRRPSAITTANPGGMTTNGLPPTWLVLVEHHDGDSIRESFSFVAGERFNQYTAIVRNPAGDLTAPVSSFVAVGEDGLISSGDRAWRHVYNFGPRVPKGKERELVIGWSTLYLSSLLAISFMNCKNTVRVERSQRPPRIKGHNSRAPAVKFYTLEIEPMKRVLESEGDVEHNGISNALHICRGHFKDYRERGLFGRQRGLYWWNAQVRGSAERGIVVKDYSVGMGTNETP
jgi:hypothetical protein